MTRFDMSENQNGKQKRIVVLFGIPEEKKEEERITEEKCGIHQVIFADGFCYEYYAQNETTIVEAGTHKTCLSGGRKITFYETGVYMSVKV